MRFSEFLLVIFRFLVPPTLIAPFLLYLYPALNDCHFPVAKRAEAACYFGDEAQPGAPAELAQFRLLALADPQLEGDSSLPDPNGPLLPGLERWQQDGIAAAVQEVLLGDVPRILQSYRKRIDLWGNDLYLAHVYRTMSWWTKPTHTVVLGDLLGSQWIDDAEFGRRSDRFWNKVFKGTGSVPSSVTGARGRREVLGQDEAWSRRIIAVAGNHDIGYAGDIDEHRIHRFEERYGSVNWEIRFMLNESAPSDLYPAPTIEQPLNFWPELRVVVLNSMNLDKPAYHEGLRKQTHKFLDDNLFHKTHSQRAGTVILTHIPLYKKEGVCVDPPFFDYFPADQGGGVKEQNHLSEYTSAYILDGLYPRSSGGHAIILNGHDHEGCDTYHYRDSDWHYDSDQATYLAKPWELADEERKNDRIEGLREITVRSMMGSYSGNAGMLSAWWDGEAYEWKFEYDVCVFGVQHIWWGVHIFVIVEVMLGVVGTGLWLRDVMTEARRDEKVKTA